ncbi:uncharacterized protein [Pocillopora verrucosa]|uniref:uncharacterized protein n=1 Tax=Pocillopora verrucosa TaxID=203993 RepID=UPI0033407F27
MRYLSGQLSLCPLQEDSMHISCADNPTLQRLEIRKMNLERALLPGPLCASLANDPTFKGWTKFLQRGFKEHKQTGRLRDILSSQWIRSLHIQRKNEARSVSSKNQEDPSLTGKKFKTHCR